MTTPNMNDSVSMSVVDTTLDFIPTKVQPDRKALRAAKEARKQREAAEKRREKAAALNVTNEQANSILEQGTQEGTGLARYGNFHSYYQFNQVAERIQYLPSNLAHDLSRSCDQSTSTAEPHFADHSISPSNSEHTKQQSTSIPTIKVPLIALPGNTNRSLIYLDVGCNEGDLTEGLFAELQKQSTDSNNNVFIYAIGCDIDAQLIERAQQKYQSNAQSIYFHADLTDDSILDQLITSLPTSVDYSDRKFDLISCHAVLMWIHLNHGTNRVVEWLVRLCSMTRNLIIEFQPYRHYKSAIHRLKKSLIDIDTVWHWSSLTDEWKGEGNVRRQVTMVLERCGMVEKRELGVTTWDRPIVWFAAKE